MISPIFRVAQAGGLFRWPSIGNAPSTTSTADTHDGGKKRPWHQRVERVNARAAEYRSNRGKLREDIIFAMDGPAEGEVLDVIRKELDPEDFAKFGAPDYEPELKGLLSQTQALRTIARLVMEERARLEFEQDEEEAIFLLLN